MPVLEPRDTVRLENYLTEGDNSGKLTVVEFFYDNGSICVDNESVLGEMAAIHKHVKFIRADAKKLKIHMEREKIKSYPTYKFYKNGKEELVVVYEKTSGTTLDGQKVLKELREILEKNIMRFTDGSSSESKDSDGSESKDSDDEEWTDEKEKKKRGKKKVKSGLVKKRKRKEKKRK